MGCYGIGIGRTMAAIVEKYHDDNGMIWPTSVTPFHCHLINLNKTPEFADLIYRTLLAEGIDVLYDDRLDIAAGEKFVIADLICIPIRLVVSIRTKNNVEWKIRGTDKTRLY